MTVIVLVVQSIVFVVNVWAVVSVVSVLYVTEKESLVLNGTSLRRSTIPFLEDKRVLPLADSFEIVLAGVIS